MTVAREDAIVRSIKRLLERRGAWHVKTTGIALAGCPDILACYRGHFLAIEIKSLVGRIRPNQQRQLELVDRAGGTALLARDVKTVRDYLDDIDSTVTRRGATKEAD